MSQTGLLGWLGKKSVTVVSYTSITVLAASYYEEEWDNALFRINQQRKEKQEMKTRQLETLKEVLHIADDLADLMCNGTQITNFRNGQVRDLDLTINCINAGHEIVDKQLKLNKEIKKETT